MHMPLTPPPRPPPPPLLTRYDGDYKPLLDAVRASIDGLAAGWTRDQKDACLNETAKSFQMSGALLRAIAAPVAK